MKFPPQADARRLTPGASPGDQAPLPLAVFKDFDACLLGHGAEP